MILNNGFYGGFLEKDNDCCAEQQYGACLEGYRYSAGEQCGRGQSECRAFATCCTRCDAGDDEDACPRFDKGKFGKSVDCTPTWQRFVGVYVALGILIACLPCCCCFVFQRKRARDVRDADRRERGEGLEMADATPTELASADVLVDAAATPENVAATDLHATAVDEVKAVFRHASGPSVWESYHDVEAAYAFEPSTPPENSASRSSRATTESRRGRGTARSRTPSRDS